MMVAEKGLFCGPQAHQGPLSDFTGSEAGLQYHRPAYGLGWALLCSCYVLYKAL